MPSDLDVAHELEQFEHLRRHLHRGGTMAHYVIDGPRIVSPNGAARSAQQAIWFSVDAPPPVPAGKRKVFFTVNPSQAIPPTNARGNAARKQWIHAQNAYISCINCLYAEWDAEAFGNDLAAVLDHIEHLPELGIPLPSALTNSGGGYQGYWLLAAAYRLDSADARAHATHLQPAWVQAVSGDRSVHDLRRILRVPGTWNVKPKYGGGRLCYFEWLHLDQLHALEDLAELLPPPAPAPDRGGLDTYAQRLQRERPNPATQSAMEQAADRYIEDALRRETQQLASLLPGGRSHALHETAMRLGAISKADWGGTLTESQIEVALLGAASANGLIMQYGESDIRRQIANGYDRTDALIRPAFRRLYPDLFPASPRPSQPPDPPPPPDEPPPGNGDAATPPKLTSRDYLRALKSLGFEFRINAMNQTLEVNGEPISDVQAAQIRSAMRDAGFSAGRVMEDAYIAAAAANAYHPIRDYLAAVAWDGHDHIADLAAHLHDANPLVEHDGTKRTLSHIWLRRWLIGAVAKVLYGTQNMMLVIDGPQGSGKSSLARWFCSGLPEYHIEQRIDPDRKDDVVKVISSWIWEVGELGATVRRADVEALKHFITMENVSVRKAYGRFDTRARAVASFFGSINNDIGFLNDPTGSRRYLVTTVTGIDWDYTRLDVHQLWAQARAYVEQGESGLLTKEESDIQRGVNKRYEIDDPVEDFLRRAYDLDLQQRSADWFVPTAQIVDTLQTRGIRGDTRAIAMALSRTLARIGLAKARPGAERGYYGLRLKPASLRPEPHAPPGPPRAF